MKTTYQLGYEAGVWWVELSLKEHRRVPLALTYWVARLREVGFAPAYCDGFEKGARAQETAEIMKEPQL